MPVRDLLHPGVIATMTKAMPDFQDLVIQAGLKVCRKAARRMNAIAAFVEEHQTGKKCLSPADNKTFSSSQTLLAQTKNFCELTSVNIADQDLLNRVLRLTGAGGLIISKESSDDQIIAAGKRTEELFKSDKDDWSATNDLSLVNKEVLSMANDAYLADIDANASKLNSNASLQNDAVVDLPDVSAMQHRLNEMAVRLSELEVDVPGASATADHHSQAQEEVHHC